MIIAGDCLEKLKLMDENSVDAVVTDPPYGWRFMGKAWDAFDIEKKRVAELNRPPRKDGKSRGRGDPSLCAGSNDQSLSGNRNFQKFTEDWAREAFRVLKPGGHMLVFCGPRTYHRMASGLEDAGFEIRDQLQWLFGSGFPKSMDISKAIDKQAGAEREVVGPNKFAHLNGKENVHCYGVASRPDETAPSTDAAKQYQGWGTALKPANEPICLARKPISEKTVAANVVLHGTGGLNIDASRIGVTANDINIRINPAKDTGATSMFGLGNGPDGKGPATQGRWPANLILDENAAAILDEQSGYLHGAGNKSVRTEHTDSDSKFGMGGGAPTKLYDKGGFPSRFFYVAKASKKERGEGNNHPTVKPIKLMEYLIRLITPANGTVLDPFMGSGSTGVAAKNLGFQFIGIEMNEEYVEIADKRIG